MNGCDGASAPRGAGEWAGGVTIAARLPAWACAVQWPSEMPCGEPAQVSVTVRCSGRAHMPGFAACVTCACEVQRLAECPACGAGASFTVHDLGGAS